MNEIQNLIPEEQANLHIVENMDVNNLPELMKNVLSLANTPAEKDMLLMSALVACGSVMPNLYVKYGISAKRYYPNLQLFIVGSAACGKGIANLALELVKPIHEATPLTIPLGHREPATIDGPHRYVQPVQSPRTLHRKRLLLASDHPYRR